MADSVCKAEVSNFIPVTVIVYTYFSMLLLLTFCGKTFAVTYISFDIFARKRNRMNKDFER